MSVGALQACRTGGAAALFDSRHSGRILITTGGTAMSTQSTSTHDRREFLASVGQGMLAASVGAAMASDLGLAPALADNSDDRLTFGPLEPLVGLMQDTPPDRLQPQLVEKIRSGVDLRTLTAAGALANARSFGGQDYIGFHTIMALMPAWQMSKRMPTGTEALPVLKVLYRNSERIQQHGGRRAEVLKPIHAEALPQDGGGQRLQKVMRTGEMDQAERTFCGLSQGEPADAYNALLHIVQDDTDVHRVALAWRAWDVLQLTGKEYAHTLLRQSVRYCTDAEAGWIRRRSNGKRPIRTTLPRMLDEYKLLGKKPGTRQGDDQWLAELTDVVFSGNRDQAAEAVASALADGYSAESVGEAISLAANQLVLHDPGRSKDIERKGHCERLKGSVHGDSVGVHASDAANAWRNIARVSNHRNTMASLITAAFHNAGQSGRVRQEPYPFAELHENLRDKDPAGLLMETDKAIRNQDQAGAAAAVALYGEQGHAAQPVFELLLKYAVSQDGALHAEKYYQTVTEEFRTGRPAFRWNHLIGLARVTASEYGWPAPGHDAATSLLKG